MGETAKTDKVSKKSWFDGLKVEFKKIIWPTREALIKQTIAVVAVSVALGVVITILDQLVQYGLEFLIK